MGQGNAYIPQHGTVRQVPLQSGDRQFGREVLKERIGNPQVPFRVLEIYRIHLMRHGRGTHFPFLDLLLEVLHGDIGPHIPVQVDQDGIDPFQPVEQGSHMVVVLYLGGGEGVMKPQMILRKVLPEFLPPDRRIRHMVCIEVPGSSPELGRVGNLGEQFLLFP